MDELDSFFLLLGLEDSPGASSATSKGAGVVEVKRMGSAEKNFFAI
jgi:hypothetical protein